MTTTCHLLGFLILGLAEDIRIQGNMGIWKNPYKLSLGAALVPGTLYVISGGRGDIHVILMQGVRSHISGFLVLTDLFVRQGENIV